MGKFFSGLQEEIMKQDIPEEAKQELLKAIIKEKGRKANVMVTGATGCGKSSTINALFGEEKAKVGTTPSPETMDISKYELENLVIWDSPGLGDGKEADERHTKGIQELLRRKDDEGKLLIDLVIVIVDGSSRDLGTSYELISKVVMGAMADSDKNRVIVAINKIDMMKGGRHWDHANNCPKDDELKNYIKETERIFKNRIKEGSGVEVKIVSYNAGYKEEGQPQEPSYNLSKLLYFILENIPEEKRLHIAEEIDYRSRYEKEKMDEAEYQRLKAKWGADDEEEDWRRKSDEKNEQAREGFWGRVTKGAMTGAALGSKVGSVFGPIGSKVGAIVGGIGGAIFGGLFG